MSYVEKSLSAGEELKHRFQFNWTINLNVCVQYFGTGVVIAFLWEFFGAPLILVFIFPALYHLKIICTEYAVTTKRVIFKEGIIARRTEEQLLTKVETVEVNQGIIGRLFDFGNVKVTGTGNSEVIFKHVDAPLEVKKKIEELL